MKDKITEITFKQRGVCSVNVTPIAYCLESPYTLFNQSDKPICLVSSCDEQGKFLGDMIFRWDNIECIREVKKSKK